MTPKSKQKNATAPETHYGADFETPAGDGNRRVSAEFTPPSEIDDGHDIPHEERARHGGEQFGSLSNIKPVTRERMNYGSRPGGSQPDKRTKIDPEAANIPARTGLPVLF